MLVFLLPLAMAIAGAFLVRGSEGRETLGALVGLLAGFAVSVAWTRYRNKKR
jgi:positive regulator of sigma E activity